MGPIPLESPVDSTSCRLLGPTALVVQGLLGVLVLLSLVVKRQREKPMRKWRIWMFDVSKQVVGQVVVHSANVFLAWFVGRSTSENPCVLYFLHILVDTTLGVGLLYIFLRLFTYIISDWLHWKGFMSGQYGEPPSFFYWSRQATVYVFALLTMKTIVVFILEVSPWLFTIAEWMLGWTDGHNSLQVIFVMGVFPITMNILQFWLIDSIVKASASVALVLDTSSDSAARDPLIAHDAHRAEEDDDEERTLAVGTSTAVLVSESKMAADSGASTPRTAKTPLTRKPSYAGDGSPSTPHRATEESP